MSTITNVCVYCGSSDGIDPSFGEAAATLGQAFAENGMGLVYGGGSIGLMGRIARATMASGGRVVGVIPRFLHDREVMLREVSELIVTEDMHERKRIMFERADAFVALPGGIGTLEELVEMMTWSQLGRHDKPIALLNVKGFWDPFAQLINHMSDAGFITAGRDVSYDLVTSVDELIPLLRQRGEELEAARTPEPDTLLRL